MSTLFRVQNLLLQSRVIAGRNLHVQKKVIFIFCTSFYKVVYIYGEISSILI